MVHSLKEHIYSVLIVSTSDSFKTNIMKYLPEATYKPIFFTRNIVEAQREIVERFYDLIIINSPLSDDSGTKLAIDISSKKQSVVLLFVHSENYNDIYNKVSDFGVFTIRKPLIDQNVMQGLDLAKETRERIRNMDKNITTLEEKMAECDKRINSTFNPSKTAEINFNFILSKYEEEFKSFAWLAENEREKTEFYSYLKIIFLLFNEKYDNIEMKHLSEKLYTAITKKGYKTLKEYLYYLYFKKKDNTIIYNIDKINDILKEAQINKDFNVKFCRFALFTSFLIREIIKYANEIKNMMELKVKTKEFIDVINNKLKIYKAAYSFKKN